MIYFEADIPEITTNPFLCFLLGRLGHGGLLVLVFNTNKSDAYLNFFLYSFWVAPLQLLGSSGSAVASPVTGYALRSAPTKGRRIALPPDELGYALRSAHF